MKNHFSNLHVRQYRNLDHTEIVSISRVNLVTGQHGIGKTSFLEAIYLLTQRGSPLSLFKVISQRISRQV